MGLDAHVCCDCFERGRLRSSPPPGCKVSVGDDGGLLCGSEDLDVQIAFDVWLWSEACEHEFGHLVSHRLGNIALVAALRAEMGQQPERFPLILSRVIYNGVHGGDYIPVRDVPRLVHEIEALTTVRCADADLDPLLQHFAGQMQELTTTALRVGKPLVF